jgi:hypothetical protein
MGSDESGDQIGGISRARIASLFAEEQAKFASAHPLSKAMLEQGAETFLNRVPLHWMSDWPMPFPMLAAKAKGAKLTDVDGVEFDDFCLGDTGSMFGHSPKPVTKAIRQQASKGLTYILPTEDAVEVGRLLTNNRKRRQPVCPASGEGGDRARQNIGVQRLLSRRGGRNFRQAEGREDGAQAGARRTSR